MKIDICLTTSLLVIYLGWICWLLWSADSTPMQIAGIITMALGCSVAVVTIIVVIVGLFISVLKRLKKRPNKRKRFRNL